MIFDDDDDTHMGTCNDGVRAGSSAFPGEVVNLVGRIIRGCCGLVLGDCGIGCGRTGCGEPPGQQSAATRANDGEGGVVGRVVGRVGDW